MDFRFAGFISASLLAHLGLLVGGAQPLTPKIGGEAKALHVTLVAPAPLANLSPAPARLASQPHELTSHTDTAPGTAAIRQRPAVAPAARPPLMPTRTSPAETAPAARPEPASAAAAASTSLHASTQISAALQNQLEEKFSYPWLARKRGWQGRVTLSLHIGKNGDLSRWEIARTSGYQVLDRSALDNAKRIHSLPEAAGLLNGTALDLLVPVHYRLLDS